MDSSSNKRKAEEIDAPAPKRQQTSVVAREPSIFGVKPVDDVTKYIADFIAEHCQLENVEVCGDIAIGFMSLINLRTDRLKLNWVF